MDSATADERARDNAAKDTRARRTLGALALALDARLMAVPKGLQYAAVTLTTAVMIWTGLPHVPRAYVDYSGTPVLEDMPQPETYGTDTIADMYAAKVVLNDVADMYTRENLDQTPLERATWSKEAAAPYPPAMLLTAAALHQLGAWTGLGYYGIVLLLAAVFVGGSARYFLSTRWYLFPLLYLNFEYFAERFVHVQDGSYLAMLVVILAALVLADRLPNVSHALIALGITMKFSPLAYVRNVTAMRGSIAALFIGILLAGLVLPFALWTNYEYIYGFHDDVKGNAYDTAAALLVTVPLTGVLWYVEAQLGFDLADRIGWDVVPFAMFLGIKMRVARHLLIVLLVPDRRGPRNVVAALGLALHAVLPDIFRLGSVLYIMSILLCGTLAWYLGQVGWDTVRADFRNPRRALAIMLGGRAPAASRASADVSRA